MTNIHGLPKILVSTAERIGDILFCTPAIHLLKKYLPNTKIDCLVFSNIGVEVLKNNPDVHQVHVTNQGKNLPKLAHEYPVIVNLTYEFSKYLNNLSSEVITIGLPDRNKHRAQQALEFAQSLLQCPIEKADSHYFLYPQSSDTTQVKKLLHEQNVDPEQDILIGCHLGCHRVASRSWKFWSRNRHIHKKVWPLENYIELANRLKKANARIQFIITGSASEQFLANDFLQKVPFAINMIGKTSILETSAMMDLLKVYITHDTGTLHIACARKTPLVALFGPTTVEFTGPYPLDEHHTLLREESMAKIAVDDVYAAIWEKL